MANAIADYLTEFRLDGSPEGTPKSKIQQSLESQRPSQDDTAELVRLAETRVRQEEQLAHAHAMREALANEQSRAQAMLQVERSRWVQDEAEKLTAALSSGLRSVETELQERIARVLAPFINQSIHEQVLAELALTLRALMTDKNGFGIEISGRTDLLDALKERIGEDGDGVNMQFLEGHGSDVRIVAGETVIESQLNSWIDKVTNAVGRT